MSIIRNKNSVFAGYEFQNQPFESNDKFSIFIPKERDTLSSLVQKTQDPKYRENAFRSPFYSPQATKEKFYSAPQSDLLGASKFREKLATDLEKAKELENATANRNEQQPEDTENNKHHHHVTLTEPQDFNCPKGFSPQTTKSKKKVLI